MKEDFNKSTAYQRKIPKKFWETTKSTNLNQPKDSLRKIFDPLVKSKNSYQTKLTRLEQQYSIIQMILSRQNSILGGIVSRNLSLANKIKRPSSFLIIKCLLASGIVYGTIYAGIWGNQEDSDHIVEVVVNKDMDKAKSDIITAYNDAVKFLGEQAQALPENSANFLARSQKSLLDFYEELKTRMKSE